MTDSAQWRVPWLQELLASLSSATGWRWDRLNCAPRPVPAQTKGSQPRIELVCKVAAAYPGSCQGHEPLGHESSDVEP